MTDANHCTRTTQIDILSPNELLVTPQVVSPNCNANDGSITLNVSGGTGTLTYSWNPPVAGNTNVAIGLGAGVYEVSITDSLLCTQSFTLTLSDINAPQVNVIDSSISCYGLCDGSIALNIINTNPVNILWNNNSTDTSITNLCLGNYSAIITDAVTGCATAITKEITQPDSLLLGNPVTADPICFGTCTGTINAIVFGGTLPYSYQWQPVSENNSRADSLCSGTFTLTVTDKNSCSVQQSITLIDPPSIISSGIVTNSSCSSVPNGAIDVSVSGGIPDYSYHWIEGSVDTTQDLTNVFYGDYTLVIFDSIACTDTIQFQIGTVDTVIANAGNDVELCFSQTALLDASASFTNIGSLTYQWIEQPINNTISINDSTSVQPPIGNNSYQLIVANSAGCSDTDTVVVKINAFPIVDAGADLDILEGEIKGIGGSPTSNINGSIYSWLPNLTLDNDSVANPVTSTTVTTTYVVTVLDTLTGCSAKDSIQVKVTPQIVISNGISPNGDGKNDAWAIDLIYKFPDNEVEIYNRWGELLYYKQRYDNSWNGTFKGKPLPVGTYYYVIKLNDAKYPDPITGPLTIFK